MELVCQHRNSNVPHLLHLYSVNMGKSWKYMSAAQNPLVWGRFRVNSVSTEGGEKCLGLHVVCWVEFQSKVWHSCQAVQGGSTVPLQRTAEF